MDEIHLLLQSAWQKLLPRLQNDPTELKKRLARRHLALLSHPPRSWCLVLRSTDSRLDRYATDYVDKTHRHDIVLDFDAIHYLCRPIHIPRPGLPISELASLLGTTPAGLLAARVRNQFQTHYIPSRHGKPTPLLYSPLPLDPSSRGFRPYDPIWSETASHTPGRIPHDLHQILTRVPIYVNTRPYPLDIDHLHPEHPHRDPPPRKHKSLALPPPPPDYVWYKYKDGQYVGHDWRNPLAAANYHKRQIALEKSRIASKKRRDRTPSTKYEDKLQFRGHRFLCPQCQRLVNYLYFPLPRLQLLGNIPSPPPSLNPEPRTPNPHPGFACKSCHRVTHIARHKHAWNQIVTDLTAGLLYGHEVPKPDWFSTQIKNQNSTQLGPQGHIKNDSPLDFAFRQYKYSPKPNRAPSQRRPQIESLMLKGHSIQQIAHSLSLSVGTILFYSKQIYKEHNVRSLLDLLLQFGIPLRPGMRGPGKAKRGQGRQPRTNKPTASSLRQST